MRASHSYAHRTEPIDTRKRRRHTTERTNVSSRRQQTTNPVHEIVSEVIVAIVRVVRRVVRLVWRHRLASAIGVVALIGIIFGVNTVRNIQAQIAEEQATEQALQKAAEQAAKDNKVVTTTENGLVFTAKRSFQASEVYANLLNVLADFEEHGYTLGFVMHDIDTGYEMSYNKNDMHYSASAIKGPYCLALYQYADTTNQYLGVSGLVEQIIVNSDNDSYFKVRDTFGDDLFHDWLVEAGLNESEASRIAADSFVDVSAAEMYAMWTQGYTYLTSGSANSKQLAGYFSQATHSVTGALMGGTYTTWTKPGWYPLSEGFSATNDCGIVQSDCGDYVLTVLSDAPEDFEALAPVIDALNQVHGQMCGGATDVLLTSATNLPISED